MIETTLMNLTETIDLGVSQVTDAAMLMGAWVGPSSIVECSFAKLIPSTEVIPSRSEGRVMCAHGEKVAYAHPSFRGLTIFPAFKKPVESFITEFYSRIMFNEERIVLKKEKSPSGRVLYCFDYGAFPQDVVFPELRQEMEKNFQSGGLSQKTGHVYTIDNADLYPKWMTPLMHPIDAGMDLLQHGGGSDQPFTPIEVPEYQFGESSRYVRLTAKVSGQQLSTGEVTEQGKPYWVEVQPLEWVVVPQTEGVYSRRGVLSGLPWHYNDARSDYSHSDIAAYLTTCFDVEIMQSHQFCRDHIDKRPPRRVATHKTTRAVSDIARWTRLENELVRT